MAAPPPSPPPQSSATENESETLISFYSNYLWKRIPIFSNSSFIAKISSFYKQFGRARSRRRKPCLPLPLPYKSLYSSLVLSEASRIFEVIEDILEHIFSDMHTVRKNLQYWQAKAEGSNAEKAYFMLFERGPHALVGGTVELVRNFIAKDSSFGILCHSASEYIAERVTTLDSLQCMLAKFLAEVYMEVEKQRENMVSDPHKSLTSLLVVISRLFSDFEASIGHLHATSQIDSSTGGTNSLPLAFNKITEVDQGASQWTDGEIQDAIALVYQNLHKLDSCVSELVAKNCKPKKIRRYWVRYTFGAVGLSVCSLWVVRHSRLGGSPDIDNWVREAKELTISFWTEHLEQPLLSIRDELFETFRKRHKGVMEAEEVQLTSNSLRRMLLAFCEETNGKTFDENSPDQEMLEIVMARYEKELMHPIKSVVSGGELPRAMLIQIQKLKLDIETAMLELNQILRANEINFAILAALPAFVLIVLGIMVVQSWLTQVGLVDFESHLRILPKNSADKGAEGRGRIARRQRRLLIVEIERRIMHYQTCIDLGQSQDAECSFGLVLYTLDRLYRAVEKHAKATGEWNWLRQDILDLAKPDIQTTYKLAITSRMERAYDCLLPSLQN